MNFETAKDCKNVGGIS